MSPVGRLTMRACKSVMDDVDGRCVVAYRR